MASPGITPTFAWNGLVTITPRLEGSRPPQDLRICTGCAMPCAHTCTLFYHATGFGSYYRMVSGFVYGNPKEKPPMALVGLTLGVGQSWNQYALHNGKNLPIPRPHKPTKNIGGMQSIVYAVPTVATPLAPSFCPILVARSTPPKKPKI